MKLSVFKKAKPLPTNKEEKHEEAKFASRPHLPEVVNIRNSDELIEIVTNYVYSPSVFKKHRLKDEFVSSDFLVLDIDEGLTIDEAEIRVKESGYACLCVPSTSHTPEAHRFRLIFPLSRTITNIEDFEASMKDLIENGFPECDPIVANNPAAFYFASTLEDGFFLTGELLEPIRAKKPLEQTFARPNTESRVKVSDDIKETIRSLYGEDRTYIPECLEYFLKNGSSGLKGEWTCTVNAVCFTLALQGLDHQTIHDLIESIAPNPLDKKDIYTINYAVKDGQKERELNG